MNSLVTESLMGSVCSGKGIGVGGSKFSECVSQNKPDLLGTFSLERLLKVWALD